MTTAQPSLSAAQPGPAAAGQPALPDQTDAPAPVVRGDPVEVSDGVFVIPDNRVPLVPNVGFVVGDSAALVIDTGLGPRNGARVLDQARRLAGARPLYLTTTHFHPEHGFGAQAFRGAATIIYNAAQHVELRRKGAGYIEMFTGMSPAYAAELEGAELTGPDITYDSRAEIDLGGHTAVLQSRGPAHTASDQSIQVDGRVLFTGDLLETRSFPIVPYFPPFDTDVDVAGWITVLGQFLALDPAVVVPGHGEVTDTTAIRDVRDYLDYVRRQTARLQADGASPDDAAAAIETDAHARWATWENPYWIGLAVRALYQAGPPERATT
jgi:glyoxylase-like metal-dependent hydrolase (beta-lactamase superfamily II)